MTPEEIKAELRECLRLQTELEAKRDELIGHFKRIIEDARGDRRRIIVEIDGEIYELGRQDLTQQTIELGRKHRGFFSEYRLIKLGKPI
jgi:predicted transcriptional regulator